MGVTSQGFRRPLAQDAGFTPELGHGRGVRSPAVVLGPEDSRPPKVVAQGSSKFGIEKHPKAHREPRTSGEDMEPIIAGRDLRKSWGATIVFEHADFLL